MTDWQLDHAPGWNVTRRSDDGFTIALHISRNNQRLGTAELRLTPVSAEHLHAALCFALDGRQPPTGSPECRQPIRYPGSTR
ncbi:hypothetical protein ABVG11_21405 [Streptomyces sp. HD1123-B1]|uniref:hypothetical protein n=1 Tax=Streptomyces huangiella TaxID=3228804 RepID=UPI003D7CA698